MFHIRGVQWIPLLLLHARKPTKRPNDPSADAIDHLLGAEAGCLAAHQVMKRP